MDNVSVLVILLWRTKSKWAIEGMYCTEEHSLMGLELKKGDL